MWYSKICESEEKQLILDRTLLSLHKLFNTELRINYIPEIRNGCNVWEQAFRHYCVDPLVFDRWGYTLVYM